MDYGGDWLRLDYNFDNIFHAIITMFNVSLLEGWTDVMFQARDLVGID